MNLQLRRVGWDADTLFFSAIRPDAADNFPSVGAKGCFLSHLQVLREASETGRHLLLMEDDLNFCNDFRARWPGAIRDLAKTEWSLFYPAYQNREHNEGLFAVPPTKPLLRAHMVLFNKNCIGQMCKALETILTRPAGDPSGGPMHVDGAYSTIRAQNPHLNTFSYSPSLGYQRSSRSDITPSLSEWMPGIEQLRRLKGRLLPGR